MNIFKHRADFFGSLSSEVTDDSLRSLFRLAKEIRSRLGKKGYLLDCYLSVFFDGLNSKIAYDAADDGFLMGGKLQAICFQVLDAAEPQKPHPLYKCIQEDYKQQKSTSPFQERYTQMCMLLLSLADEWLTYSTAQFTEEQVKGLDGVVDEIRLQELFDQISYIAGEAMMEELNQRLKERFMIVPLVTAFAQGVSDDLIGRLTYRDPETSKQIFQLFMDTLE